MFRNPARRRLLCQSATSQFLFVPLILSSSFSWLTLYYFFIFFLLPLPFWSSKTCEYVHTDVNVRVPLPLWYASRGSGGKTQFVFVWVQNDFLLWSLSLLLFVMFCFPWTANVRAREFFSKESLTTKNALSISLYLIGCITGSMSHQPLYHRRSNIR